MLHIVRNNSPYTVIILCIFALVIKMQALAHPHLPEVLPGHLAFGAIVTAFNFILGGSAFGYTMLSVIMIVAQGLYLNAIVNKYKLFSKPTYAVTFLYLVFTSLAPSLNFFSEALMINWCMIGSVDILLSFHQTPQPRKHIFNAGFILCLAAVLQFQAVVYFPLLLLTLALLRSFNAGEWIVSVMGYLTPLYFFAGILFIMDKLPQIPMWLHIETTFNRGMPYLVYTIGAVLGILILLACGVFVLQGYMGRISVFMRRNWVMIGFYLLLSVIIATDLFFTTTTAWLIVMPALSLMIANAFYLEKSKVFSNFVFYFSLVLVLFCQLTIK